MLIFGEYLTVNINQVHIGKEMMVKILRPPTFSLFTKLILNLTWFFLADFWMVKQHIFDSSLMGGWLFYW